MVVQELRCGGGCGPGGRVLHNATSWKREGEEPLLDAATLPAPLGSHVNAMVPCTLRFPLPMVASMTGLLPSLASRWLFAPSWSCLQRIRRRWSFEECWEVCLRRASRLARHRRHSVLSTQTALGVAIHSLVRIPGGSHVSYRAGVVLLSYPPLRQSRPLSLSRYEARGPGNGSSQRNVPRKQPEHRNTELPSSTSSRPMGQSPAFRLTPLCSPPSCAST